MVSPPCTVGTFESYRDLVKQYRISAIPYPWESDDDEKKMLDDLDSGTIVALIIDNVFVRCVRGSGRVDGDAVAAWGRGWCTHSRSAGRWMAARGPTSLCTRPEFQLPDSNFC